MTNSTVRLKAYALLCALAVVACVAASYPVAEIGINDDWSYIYSAKLMAETGHIHYIGWASAMLGWMIPLGAAFSKIFGFSFTAVRAAGLTIAAVTAFLLQRVLVRSGLSERNATVATLALVLSPVYIALASTFLTDVPGLFVLLLCFYCCLRARQQTGFGIFRWIAWACILDALGGTARQTAWLGLFLMVPSTLYLLRKRGVPWVACTVVWLASLGFVYGSLRWFSHQTYSLGEALVANYIDRDLLFGFLSHVTRAGLVFVLLLGPILIALTPAVDLRDRRVRRWGLLLAGVAILFFGGALYRHAFVDWLAPFDGSLWTEHGFEEMGEIGKRGVMLGVGVRLVLTLFTLLCLFLTGAFLLKLPRAGEQGLKKTTDVRLPMRDLVVMIAPMFLAYVALTLHRALFARLYDRYLVLVLWVPALLFCRLYQDQVAAKLPRASLALAILSGVFSLMANHDFFSQERARLSAADELVQAGVSREQFFGGWEYDGWTQVDHYGFVNSAYIRMPSGFSAARPISLKMKSAPCKVGWARDFPAIQPRYTLSYDATSCGGASSFTPVPYASWLPPYGAKIYIDKVLERTY